MPTLEMWGLVLSKSLAWTPPFFVQPVVSALEVSDVVRHRGPSRDRTTQGSCHKWYFLVAASAGRSGKQSREEKD